jgi:hypothetical protein
VLDNIQALAEVVRDEKRSKTDKDIAIAALRDLAAKAETDHDRSNASHILKSIGALPAEESEIPNDLLRLLYLVDTADTPENNTRARELYRQQIETNVTNDF